MTPFIIGVDVWEGSLEIDEPLITAAGVKFFIVRMNDISGGTHPDANFLNQWAQVENFIRLPYFVYNPWETAIQNFNFLAAHMPAGVKRVAIDIELKYAALPPSAYASAISHFIGMVKNLWQVVIYTGEWFIPYLSSWPTEDYWWGQYPYVLYPPAKVEISWVDLTTKINALPFTAGYKAPGPVRLWQCTADRYILPGCAGRPIDINVWPGTLEELQTWAGYVPPVPPAPTLEQRVTALEGRVKNLEAIVKP